MLNVVHTNVRLSEVIVSDSLDSNHLPIVFHLLLDHVKTRNLSDMVDKFTDWEWFQSLASELMSSRIQINLREEGDIATCDFTACIASVYRLSTSKLTLLDLNKDLPGLESLLKQRRLRKLWQVTWDPACKRAVNWVTKTIRQITRRKALEWQEAKEGNCEVTLQALWPILKSLTQRDGPKAPTAVHGPVGITYDPNKKASLIADCVENQSTSHDLSDKNHEQRLESRVQGLLASVVNTTLGKVRPCDIHKLASPLKLRKACGLDGISNECHRHLQLCHFPTPWKEANITETQEGPKMSSEFMSD
jgi:hypothetical protein